MASAGESGSRHRQHAGEPTRICKLATLHFQPHDGIHSHQSSGDLQSRATKETTNRVMNTGRQQMSSQRARSALRRMGNGAEPTADRLSPQSGALPTRSTEVLPGVTLCGLQSNLLPTLLSFNMLAKIGSVPSLGGLNEGSLISGLSSLQFPDLDVNGYSIATPQGEHGKPCG